MELHSKKTLQHVLTSRWGRVLKYFKKKRKKKAPNIWSGVIQVSGNSTRSQIDLRGRHLQPRHTNFRKSTHSCLYRTFTCNSLPLFCWFNLSQWSEYSPMFSQDPAEGVRAAKGAAWPTRGPCWRPLGVGGFFWPPRRSRSLSRGQAASATQGPARGPHAHLGGTQQTAGVSAPPPPTTTAPGDISPPPICWACFIPRSHRLRLSRVGDIYS